LHLVYPFFMIIIFTTTPTNEEAESIATKLVEEKLAACVQIMPQIKSYYLWEGKLVKDDELLLLIKTSDDLFSKVEAFIKSVHSYETPEIVAVDAKYVSAEYENWLISNTR
jgi:periplasmic divalent cation tolerance protein